MKTEKTTALVECAVMVALATILSFIKIMDLPYGGSITLCSMVPLIIVSYRRGTKWGIMAAFVFSLIQLLTGLSSIKGITGFFIVMGSILLDYVIAYTVLGLGGVFRNSVKNPAISLGLGAMISCVLRYFCSFLSGALFWSEYATDTLSSMAEKGLAIAGQILENYSGTALSMLYSLLYNGLYMIPEIILTVAVCVILGFSKKIATKY
ncbi:MAG: energy-coupled thiamine transporter ThiT [Clostridia bacterium]|nr:energy-coupled thiamine transporter ThiT [Clostridia bacterium]